MTQYSSNDSYEFSEQQSRAADHERRREEENRFGEMPQPIQRSLNVPTQTETRPEWKEARQYQKELPPPEDRLQLTSDTGVIFQRQTTHTSIQFHSAIYEWIEKSRPTRNEMVARLIPEIEEALAVLKGIAAAQEMTT